MVWKPDYLTAEQAAGYMEIDDDYDHAELLTAIGAASRAIDRHTHRQFGLVEVAEERVYTGQAIRYDYERCRWVVDIDDLMSTVGLVVTVDDTVITAPNYLLEPRNAAPDGRPWTRLVLGRSAEARPCGPNSEVAATALWGWSAVPPAVTFAAKLQTSRFHMRRESPLGIAGSPETGGETRLLAKVDPDVGVSLADYVRPSRPQ